MSARSLLDLLRQRADHRPDRRAYTFLNAGRESETLTFGQLDRRARAIAARLQQLGAKGERALLLYPSGTDYITAFYGCIAAGTVAVPAYPPRMNRNLKRFESILGDARPKVALTTDAIYQQLSEKFADYPILTSVQWLVTTEIDPEEAAHWEDPGVSADTLAFLQYTSASTSAPKGVMVSHGNILHNQELMRVGVGHHDGTVIVSWLPLFHDMGLIGVVLASLYNGVPCYLAAPVDFLKKPKLWLDAITKYGGTFSGGPDFAFQLCADTIPDEEKASLDLSSWETAFNASEPVRADTLRNFAKAFAPCGFRANALFPAYGLAEYTLFVSGTHEPPSSFARSSLEKHEPHAANGGPTCDVANCGAPVLDSRIVIADPNTRERRGEDRIGEIWLASASVAQGYWNQPALSDETFRARLTDGDGPFLRTGDLGFLHNGQLFVSGRIKDLILIRGRNLAPQDLEQTAEACEPAIKPAFAAAVSFEAAGAERLAIVAEIRREARHELDAAAAIDRIRKAVAAEHAVEVSSIVLVKPGALPKTSSGKTQRALVKQELLAGTLESFAAWRDERLVPAVPKRSATRLDRLETWLVERVAAETRRPADTIDREQSLLMFGLDSVVVMSLLGQIEQTFDVQLDVDPLFRGDPSLKQLVRRVQGVADEPTAEKPAAVVQADAPAPSAPPAVAGPRRLSVRAVEAVPVEWDVPRRVRGDAGRPEAHTTPGQHPFRSCVNPELGRALAQMGMDKTFVRGEGCWLWDAEGRRYLDFLAQYGALPFGFNPPRIWQALTAVHESAEPSFVQPSFLNAAGELAKRLLAAAPPGMAYVTFGNSGAEAVEAAIKVCRSGTGRRDILAASNGFHGKTLGALSATDKEKYQKAFGAPVEGFSYVPYGDIDALRRALATRRFAGFLVEPLQGEGGIIEPPAGYLRQARKACRETGTLFVADEIQTGLGRTGAMFVCRELGITPDVMTVAKALGGGLMPIGACLATAGAYNDEFALRHTSTFAGNTLACRAGIATLDLLEENGGALLAQVAENGARLKDELRRMAARHPGIVSDVRGRGYFLGLTFALDRHSVGDGLLGYLGEQEALTGIVVSHLLHVEGIRVGYTLNQGGVLRIEPPLVATWDECRYFLDALERVIMRIERGNLADLTTSVTGYQPPLGDAQPISRVVARRVNVLRPAAAEGRFAFLAHPLAWKDFGDIDGTLAVLSDAQLGRLSTALGDNFDPMVIGETRVTASNGKSAYGEFILVPRRAEELKAMRPDQALDEVLEAAKVAKKRGAKIIGLGAYTSVVTQGGLLLKGRGLPALTSGNSYTAVAARQTVRLAAAHRGWSLARRSVAVMGAAGAVGQALSVLLARDAGRLVLIGNPEHARDSRERLLQVAGRMVWSLDHVRGLAQPAPGSVASWIPELDLDIPARPDRAALARLGQQLLDRTRSVTISVDPAELLPHVDVVVCCTSSTERLVRGELLRTGAVVCDVSRPSNVAADVRESRPDVLVVDGGIVRMPGQSTLGFNAAIGEGNAYACMAETMMLAMEQRYEDASLGFDLPLEQLVELERLAEELGFRVLLERTERAARRELQTAEQFGNVVDFGVAHA